MSTNSRDDGTPSGVAFTSIANRITMMGAALVHFDSMIRPIHGRMRYPRSLAFGVLMYDDAGIALQYVEVGDDSLVHLLDLQTGEGYVLGFDVDNELALRACAGASPLATLRRASGVVS